MPADQLRNRTVGSKMTEREYKQLVAAAERDGLTLGEWCRELLWREPNAKVGKSPSTAEQSLLAEVRALQMSLMNILSRWLVPSSVCDDCSDCSYGLPSPTF